jgi:hypothetical protein
VTLTAGAGTTNDARSHVLQPAGVTVEPAYGRRALSVIDAELDVLATSIRAPLTARPTWILATSAQAMGLEPWALVARGATGTPVGAVVLLDHVADGHVALTTLAGTDSKHRGEILTKDPAVAYVLGEALSRLLAERLIPSPVELGPLSANSAQVKAFAEGLAGSRLTHAAAIPVIRGGRGTPPVDHLSGGMRRTLRKAANRLAADGHTSVVRFTSAPGEILSSLHLLEQVYRQRDHAHGRISELDDIVRHRIWQQRVRDLIEAGELELATLRISGDLAAYTLGVLDRPAYRLLEGRFVTRWARYAPGRLLEAAVVDQALSDPDTTTFDWMTAIAPETLLGSNHADPMVVVRVGHDPDSRLSPEPAAESEPSLA